MQLVVLITYSPLRFKTAGVIKSASDFRSFKFETCLLARILVRHLRHHNYTSELYTSSHLPDILILVIEFVVQNMC